MADEALEVGDPQNTRVGRVARQGTDRQSSDQVDAGGTKRQDIDPEQALADARKALEVSQAETEAERGARQRAEQEAREARQTTSAVSVARISDHEAALNSAIDSAKSKKTAALTAYRTAREAGDIDAEAAANDLLSQASAELTQLTRDKTLFDANKPALEARAKAPGQQQSGPTAEAQAWIQRNPRYNVDKVYQGVAVGLHNQAIDEGIVEGSRAYVRFIDEGLKDLYGDDHGKLESVGRRPGEQAQRQQDQGGTEVRDTTRRQAASSEAARGDRGTGGSLHAGNGAISYTHKSGEKLSLTYADDGKPKLAGRIPAEWMEGARICNMDPISYAADQIQIAKEIAAGGDAGLRYENSVYQ